jgi:hypothetical protein
MDKYGGATNPRDVIILGVWLHFGKLVVLIWLQALEVHN